MRTKDAKIESLETLLGRRLEKHEEPRVFRQTARSDSHRFSSPDRIADESNQERSLSRREESRRVFRQTVGSDARRFSSPDQIADEHKQERSLSRREESPRVFRQVRSDSRRILSPNQITDESNSEQGSSIFTVNSSSWSLSHISHLGSQESSPSDDSASPRDGAWVVPFDADACAESAVKSAVGDHQRNNALREICTTSSFRPVVAGANKGSSVVRPTPVRASLRARSPSSKREAEAGKENVDPLALCRVFGSLALVDGSSPCR